MLTGGHSRNNTFSDSVFKQKLPPPLHQVHTICEQALNRTQLMTRHASSKAPTEVLLIHWKDRLVGLVVKASASRVEDPRFESRLRQDFFGSSHSSDLKTDTPVATLPGAWCYRGLQWDWSVWCQYTVTG